MPVYRCKEGPLTVMFGHDSFTFAKNQLVNTNFPQVTTHPSFERVADPRLIKRAPTLDKIYPMPINTVYMSNEQLVAELKTYGVQPNPYELTDKLAYQLEMLRSLNKRSHVTVLDDDGEPMYYEEFFILEQKLKAIARAKQPVNTPEVRISKKDSEPKPVEPKLATKEEVKTKGGSVGSIDMNDDYDITREHEVDALIKAQLKHKYETKVDKLINDRDSLFKEEDIEIDVSGLSIKDFEYLTELRPFCLEEFTDEDREELKHKNLRLISLPVMFNFLRDKGIVYKFGRNSDRGFKFREVINTMIRESPRKEEFIIQLNALNKRHKEIEATTPKDVRKCSLMALKMRMAGLKKYGTEYTFSRNLEFMTAKKMYTKLTLLTQFGLKEDDHQRIYDALEVYELGDILLDYLNINNNNLEEELSDVDE